MSTNAVHVDKTLAIRACLADYPDAAPKRIVEILSARGCQVSPAHVIVVQAVVRSEKVERLAAAS